MNRQQDFLTKCDEVVRFCMKHTGQVFQCWPRETILLYVAFHAITGGLFLRRKSGQVVAVAFAWPDRWEVMHRRFEAGQSAFRWVIPRDADCLLVAEVIADKETAALFMDQAKRQWPKLKRWFTFRRKPNLMLVEISPERLRRFYGRWTLHLAGEGK